MPSPGLTRELEDFVASGALGQAIGPALASAQAQALGGPLGIENVRRGLLVVRSTGRASNNSVLVGANAPLTHPVRGSLVLCGRRPLAILLVGTGAAGASGSIHVAVTFRGTTVPIEIVFTSGSVTPFTGFWVIDTPAGGEAAIEVVARAGTADGLIFCTSNNGVTLVAVEL